MEIPTSHDPHFEYDCLKAPGDQNMYRLEGSELVRVFVGQYLLSTAGSYSSSLFCMYVPVAVALLWTLAVLLQKPLDPLVLPTDIHFPHLSLRRPMRHPANLHRRACPLTFWKTVILLTLLKRLYFLTIHQNRRCGPIQHRMRWEAAVSGHGRQSHLQIMLNLYS